MRIAVEGCAHGELEIIYETITEVQKHDGKKVDLLICCGDFQATRNLSDLNCMAVPNKFKDMGTFYKYYNGEKLAPVLTIFIGGNHEASNYLQELPYGGWVAPNIYYLGYASVVTIGGIRIAGLSGIYKGQHFMQGHYERPPYSENTMRSVYHVRNLEVFRLNQLTGTIDIFLSHDWPNGITKYGDERTLLRKKPFFRSDVENNALGSQPCMDLLQCHYPKYWFSAHLHCKFAALIPETEGTRVTKFLALDKCLPRRKFLQILEIPHNEKLPLELCYDLEWLTILYLTNHLLSVKRGMHYMPGKCDDEKRLYAPTNETKENVLKKFKDDLRIPSKFMQTVKLYDPEAPNNQAEHPSLNINHQTTHFCDTLGVDDPCVLLQMMTNSKDRSTELEESKESILDDTDTIDDVSSLCDEDSSFGIDSSGNSTTQMTPVKFPAPKTNPDVSEEDNIDSSFGMDSPLHSRPQMTSLKLPEPENSPEDISELKNDLKNFCESEEPRTELGPEENLNKSTESTDCNTTSESSNTIAKVEPDCKKFKRRNHSIYSNTE